MKRRLSVFAVIFALGALAPTTAYATVYAGGVDDAREPGVPGGRDIERIDTTYDADAGTWSVAVQFYDAPTTALSAMVYLSRSMDGDCGVQGSMNFFTRTDPADPRPLNSPSSAQATKSYSADGRTLTLTETGTALSGHPPCDMHATRLSQSNKTFDTVPAFSLSARSDSQPEGSAAPAGPAGTIGDGGASGTAATPKPPTMSVALPAALHAGKGGTVAIRLGDATQNEKANVSLDITDLKRSFRGHMSLRRGQSRTLHLRLDRGSRARLHRLHSVRVTLRVRLSASGRPTALTKRLALAEKSSR